MCRDASPRHPMDMGQPVDGCGAVAPAWTLRWGHGEGPPWRVAAASAPSAAGNGFGCCGAEGGWWEAAVSADTLWWLPQPQGQALSATQDVGGDGDRADPSLGPPHALSAWREGRASASPAAPPFFIAAINNPGWCCPDGTAPLPEPEGPEHQQGRAFTSLGKGKATLYPIEDPITLNEVPVVMGFLPQRAENRQNSCPG